MKKVKIIYYSLQAKYTLNKCKKGGKNAYNFYVFQSRQIVSEHVDVHANCDPPPAIRNRDSNIEILQDSTKIY